ncbi:MAG TPA: helix-turn-helix domain-containing protein [Trebonia sp.]|jgi:DNA-binding HxlR family transcriptional regulator|nr:helix-turn-helix domain-containing protein [Trebonia sp.]
MALPKDYAGDRCSLARALEIVGERWTLLIVRDAFFGVRRFGDFAVHLDIPRAVLTSRLAALVDAGVLTLVPGAHGHDEYALTDKGRDLLPVVRSLMVWGDEHYSEVGPRRVFRHAADDGEVRPDGICAACGDAIDSADLVVAPGPGLAAVPAREDPVSIALNTPHRLLEPLRSPA